MKFYLEHGIKLNLVTGHAPGARVASKAQSKLHRSLRHIQRGGMAREACHRADAAGISMRSKCVEQSRCQQHFGSGEPNRAE